MSETNAVHRLPRARIDPIDSRHCALSLILALIDPMIRPETIVVLLDHERRGLSIVAVDGSAADDSLTPIIELVVELSHRRDEIGGVLLGSVRPGGSTDDTDRQRWADAADLCEQAGLELVEWFVVGKRISCPRELCGDPPRWSM